MNVLIIVMCIGKKKKQSKCYNFMEKSGVIKKDDFGEFLTWESTHKIKLSMRKKQDIEL